MIARKNRELATLAVALVLSMSTWFSTAAVLGQLRKVWGLSNVGASWLTIAVQLGFVAGAIVSAFTNLADRIPPLRLMLFGTIGAAVANAGVVLAHGLGTALIGRFVTGAFLALVYPPSLKAMTSWFRQGRGFALGVMIGALAVGSSLPHLINALGGLEWRTTLLAASGLTLLGGLAASVGCTAGPDTAPAAQFDPRQLRAIVGNRSFRLASAGYFGHMWELYAMWAWMAAFYGDVFATRRSASLAAFAVIAIGATGSVFAGLMSDRRTRPAAAEQALRWSARSAMVVGFLVHLPAPIPVAAGLFWGFWVVADSAQFSAIVTEVVDARYAGTALTIQLAAGFTLTVFTIFLVPIIRDGLGWGAAFLLLAPGPLLGAWAMRSTGQAGSGRRLRL